MKPNKIRGMVTEWLRRFDAIPTPGQGYEWAVMTRVGTAHVCMTPDRFEIMFSDIDRARTAGVACDAYDGTFTKKFADTGWDRMELALDNVARLF